MNKFHAVDEELMAMKPEIYMSMLETAEVVAERYKISRERQDEYSLECQRRTASALLEACNRHLHVADSLVRHRQIALEVRAPGIAGEQVRHDLPGLLGGGERARRVADRQQRCGGFIEGGGLAALELRRHLPGFDELLLQRARPVENILDETSGDPHDVAEPLRQVEDQTVGGFGRGGDGLLSARCPRPIFAAPLPPRAALRLRAGR